jgi:putative transcriptional regulator
MASRVELIKLRGNKPQREIAEVLEITTSYYGMIETGVRNPSLKLAKKIANYFSKNVEEIFFVN